MQEVDFEVELVIADDASSDRTGEIIQKYIDNHPKGNWIKYTRHTQNIGMMPNFIWALEACQGKYIALCEGDDYWTESKKLFHQLSFLQENPNFSFSFHDAIYLYDDGSIRKFSEKYKFLDRIKNEFSLKDLEKFKWFVPTCSIVFRNIDIPKWFQNSTIGDFSLQLILSERGNFYFHRMVGGVYRIHQNGMSNFVNNYSNRLKDIRLWFINVRKLNKLVLIRWYLSVFWRFILYKFLVKFYFI